MAVLRNHDIGTGFLHELHEILNGRILPEFGSNRIRIWNNVLSTLHEAPLLGKGPDTMLLERFEKFSTFYPTLNKTLTTSIDIAHNEYLNILYHQGILGLISYLTLIVSVLKRAIPSRDTCTEALAVAVVSYLSQAFFGFSMCLVSPFFWVILALASQKPPISEALYF